MNDEELKEVFKLYDFKPISVKRYKTKKEVIVYLTYEDYFRLTRTELKHHKLIKLGISKFI